jgi:hypothetical protein
MIFFLNFLFLLLILLKLLRPEFVNITRNKMLLYLYNNLTLSMQKILPNIWNYIKQHNYKQIDPVIKVLIYFLIFYFDLYRYVLISGIK